MTSTFFRLLSSTYKLPALVLLTTLLVCETGGLHAQVAPTSDTATAEQAIPSSPEAQAPVPTSHRVYKVVDKQGQVSYTDQPPKNRTAQIIDVPATNSLPAVAPVASQEKTTADSSYKTFMLTSPQPEQVFGNEVTSITLVVALDPPLKEGHSIVFLYDGKALDEPGTDTSAEITELERGTHTSEARLLNAKGGLLLSSGNVTFQIQKTSLLNRPKTKEKPADKPNGKPDPGATNPPPAKNQNNGAVGSIGGAGSVGGAGGAGGAGSAGGAPSIGGAGSVGGAGVTATKPKPAAPK